MVLWLALHNTDTHTRLKGENDMSKENAKNEGWGYITKPIKKETGVYITLPENPGAKKTTAKKATTKKTTKATKK